jgi:hypothetical protein
MIKDFEETSPVPVNDSVSHKCERPTIASSLKRRRLFIDIWIVDYVLAGHGFRRNGASALNSIQYFQEILSTAIAAKHSQSLPRPIDFPRLIDEWLVT